MKKIAFFTAFLLIGCPVFSQCAVKEEDRDEDGKVDHITISNDFYEITFGDKICQCPA